MFVEILQKYLNFSKIAAFYLFETLECTFLKIKIGMFGAFKKTFWPLLLFQGFSTHQQFGFVGQRSKNSLKWSL